MVRMRAVFVVPLAGVVMMGGAAAAIGDFFDSPSIEPAQATVVFEHVSGRFRTCEGADGVEYVEQVVTATGTATGDPHLSGALTLHQRSRYNADTGASLDSGTVRIEDARGRWLVRGRLSEAGTDAISQGILVGRVRNASHRAPQDLTAGVRLTFTDTGSVIGQIGGELADTRLPAVISSGECRGPFEEFESDIPAPGDASAATTTRRGSGFRFFVR